MQSLGCAFIRVSESLLRFSCVGVAPLSYVSGWLLVCGGFTAPCGVEMMARNRGWGAQEEQGYITHVFFSLGAQRACLSCGTTPQHEQHRGGEEWEWGGRGEGWGYVLVGVSLLLLAVMNGTTKYSLSGFSCGAVSVFR